MSMSRVLLQVLEDEPHGAVLGGWKRGQQDVVQPDDSGFKK